MPELNFSKKQLTPLITKYGIDVEKNTLFHRIIQLFDGQPNYHVWAVKAVFGGATKFETIERIKGWAEANQKHIQYLAKNGNITSYTTAKDFADLINEIVGIEKKCLVKDVINEFNTDQRKMLIEATHIETIDNLAAVKSKEFTGWYDLLRGFKNLHRTKKNKVVKVLSAVRDANALKDLIKNALSETYIWDKEDMLNFVANNCPKVKTVYNMGPIVILEIPTYTDSHKICYGRTTWCITRSNDYFHQYVTDKKGNRQFFFFDFSRKETNELAHVGFTVSPNGGITNAHSTNNSSMVGVGIDVEGKRWNIQALLQHNNVSMGLFMNLKALKGYTWDKKSLIEFAAKSNGKINVIVDKDNIVVVRATDNQDIRDLVGFSFVPTDNFNLNAKNIIGFVLYDFSKELIDNNSITVLVYQKDQYGFASLSCAFNTYGSNVTGNNILDKYGLTVDELMDLKNIDPNVLLHKYINEGEEKSAIKLLKERADEIDVNYKFNMTSPVFASIEHNMFEVFTMIIENEKFNGDIDDGYGANLPQIILWSCYLNVGVKLNDAEETKVRNAIIDIINTNKFDINYVDMNDDTLINIAAMDASMNWLVELLAAREDVNPNQVNDINFTALGNAICNKNIEAIRLLGKRPDLLVRDIDYEVAQSNGINLTDYIKPEPFTKQETTSKGTMSESYVEALSKVFNHK